MGCSRKRVEDVRFTQGKGNYVDDIKMTGMLFGDFVRSPYAHARVVSVNKEAALALPGVVAVLTAEDLAPLGLHWMPTLAGDKQMVLADGKVLFQGQEVAYVVAEDRYIAADAVELVEVEYEELPVLTDPFEALKSDVVLREDLAGQTEGAHGPRKHHNHIFTWEAGEKDATEAVIEGAEVVAEEMVYYHRTHPCPLETCGCVASMDKVTGKLTVWGTFQAPHAIRTVVSLISGIAEHNIRIISPDIGGGFGNKVGAYPGYVLFGRGLHRDGQAGEVGRGPDGKPDVHRLRPRLLDARQDRSHERGQDHRAVVPHHGGSRRLRRLRRPHQVPGRLHEYLHRIL